MVGKGISLSSLIIYGAGSLEAPGWDGARLGWGDPLIILFGMIFVFFFLFFFSSLICCYLCLLVAGIEGNAMQASHCTCIRH